MPVIKLKTVFYNAMARGFLCVHPYPGHPKGCPNLEKGCIKNRPDFKLIAGYEWYAVFTTFNLKEHAAKMLAKHPGWSERQCRNPLYWQGGVRKTLRGLVKEFEGGEIILDIPEASGVDVFQTMKESGVILSRKPDVVVKVMLVGKFPK